MHEVFPILAGVVAGLLVERYIDSRQRVAALLVAALAIGAVASLISGELYVSPIYLVFDAAQALLAATVAVVVYRRWLGRLL